MAVKTFPEDTPAAEMMHRRRAWHRGDHYRVYRRNGTPLRIQFDVCDTGPDTYEVIPRCPCEAGVWNQPCWHAAVALRRMLREKVTK